MNIGNVILQIRGAATRFGNRVTGSAELSLAQEFPLKEESAFVVQIADSAPANDLDSGINQLMTERIAVIVALRNDTSKKDLLGFQAANIVDTVRNELFVALLGWPPPDAEGLMYYAGGQVISVDPAWLWYQFNFEATTRLQALYDPNAGALPYLEQIFAQWKVGGDNILPLPEGSELPTDLLKDPVLEDMIQFPSDFDLTAFNNDFSTVRSRYNKAINNEGS